MHCSCRLQIGRMHTCAIRTDCSKNKQLRLSQASRWPPREILLLHLYGSHPLCYDAPLLSLKLSFFSTTMRICRMYCNSIVRYGINTHTSLSLSIDWPSFSSQPLCCFMIHMPKVWFRYVRPIQQESQEHWNSICEQHRDINELQCTALRWAIIWLGGSGQDSDAREEMTDICWHTQS